MFKGFLKRIFTYAWDITQYNKNYHFPSNKIYEDGIKGELLLNSPRLCSTPTNLTSCTNSTVLIKVPIPNKYTTSKIDMHDS